MKSDSYETKFYSEGNYVKDVEDYDGFRPEDKASVLIQDTKVFDGGDDVEYKPSCWSRAKFVVWAILAVAVVGAIIGLSVAMVKTSGNEPANAKTQSGDEKKVYPPPGASASYSPKDPSQGGGRGGGGGGGGGDGGNGDYEYTAPEQTSDEDGTLKIMVNPDFSVPKGWTALWWDNFDGTRLNMSWWNYQYGYGAAEGLWAWGNQEQQFYTDTTANVDVSGGTLKITARREDTALPDGYVFQYTSGRINTKGKAAFFGGMTTADGRKWDTIRIESSLKAPQPTQGLWAAYWMLPIDLRYGVWASSGEIDIYEMKNEFLKNNMALHYGGPWPKYSERFNAYEKRPDGGTFSDDFTVVAMDWSPTEITMSMDGVQLFELKSSSVDSNGWYTKSINGAPNSPFDMPFYIILNLAVGGRYPGNATAESIMPNTFEIDYIRVFGKNQ